MRQSVAPPPEATASLIIIGYNARPDVGAPHTFSTGQQYNS